MSPDQLRSALSRQSLHEGGQNDEVLHERGDFDLNPHRRAAMAEPLKPAAVLVPIVQRQDALTVLFTQRTETLSSHPGQISFPGGRIDKGDATPAAAALREAHEEIGLPAANVDVIGSLPSYQTGSGYKIQPVVGLVCPDFNILPHPAEVADVFELPLAALLNPANHQIESRPWQGTTVRFYVIPVGERRVWGATAGIIVSLSRRLGLRS